MLGYLMYRSGRVLRRGLVAGPLICASGIAAMFGAFGAGSSGQFIATLSEIAGEASFGIYLTAKRFRPPCEPSPRAEEERFVIRRRRSDGPLEPTVALPGNQTPGRCGSPGPPRTNAIRCNSSLRSIGSRPYSGESCALSSRSVIATPDRLN